MRSNVGMLSKTLVLIVPSEGKDLYPLTRSRPQPLVSFGGEFQIIDFVLANCWSSGLRRAFVLPNQQSGLVVRYLDSLDWSENLISVYPDACRRYSGTADALFQNIGLLQLDAPDYVLVLLTEHIYEMDYGNLLQFHIKSGVQATIAANGAVDIGAYVFNAGAFRRVLLMDGLSTSNHNLERSAILRALPEQEIHTYDLKGDEGSADVYSGSVDTIDDYYRTQLSFQGHENPDIGVISSSVEIADTAQIRSSILLKGAQIGPKARIRKTIVEEGVRVPEAAIIGFNVQEDRRRFIVSDGGVVVVDRESARRLEEKTGKLVFMLARCA